MDVFLERLLRRLPPGRRASGSRAATPRGGSTRTAGGGGAARHLFGASGHQGGGGGAEERPTHPSIKAIIAANDAHRRPTGLPLVRAPRRLGSAKGTTSFKVLAKSAHLLSKTSNEG